MALAGCGGGGDYANKPRPPAPINVTAAITNSRVSVSPQRFGAGPIVLIISNQSSSAQKVIFETDELGGSRAGEQVRHDADQPARHRDAEGGRARGRLEAEHGRRRDPRRRRIRRAASASPPRATSCSHERAPRRPRRRRWRRCSPRCGAPLPASAQKTQSQTFFEQRLLADGLHEQADQGRCCARGGGFVDRRVVFRDLTGDKRDDAVVRVHSGGAAGVVAVYVFSTANRKGGKLRAIFRSQNLMRASTRVLKGVASYRTSRYEPGRRAVLPGAHHPVDARVERATSGGCGWASA